MNRSPKLKPTLWDALVVLAVLALAGEPDANESALLAAIVSLWLF